MSVVRLQYNSAARVSVHEDKEDVKASGCVKLWDAVGARLYKRFHIRQYSPRCLQHCMPSRPKLRKRPTVSLNIRLHCCIIKLLHGVGGGGHDLVKY